MRSAGLVAVLAVLIAACGQRGDPAAPGSPSRPHFAPVAERAHTARRPAGRHLTAKLRRPTLLRAAPAGRPLARLGIRTEFGSPAVLAVTGRRAGWLRVVSARLDNERRGWIPVGNARLRATSYSIHVDRSARRASLKLGKRVVRRFPVAVGRPGNETPLGRFAVTDELHPTDPTSPYGCCAIALSGHQTRLEPGWPGGDRLAIHGTPQPETIGRPASLGCMRARERDLRAVMARIPLGTPVVIRA